jgi:glucose-6-phosphate isomerase
MLKINIDNILSFVSHDEVYSLQSKVTEANKMLYGKSGKGSEFLGWLDLPSKTSTSELNKINDCAKRLAEQSDIILVIGIGGSYLGSRAVIDALSNNFSPLLTKAERKAPLILYAGENIGEDYHSELLELLDKKDYSIIVISKSGTTTEPAIAFRIFKAHIEKKYGKDNAKSRIAAITDSSKGALKKLADSEGYETFVIPDDVGGRFSVLTPVGLLPIAAAGFDITKLINGAKESEELCRSKSTLDENPADLYAAARNALYQKGKVIEILASYTPNLNYIIEWWKQLYGESEGKEGKGIFPAGVNFTADLHSMGQLVQDGMRNIFETVLSVESPTKKLAVPIDDADLDGLNFIAGKRMNEINKMAELGTMLAHIEGGVPNISLSITKNDEESLGGLIYFFEKACAVSGYLLGVNPFDQPGVEAYKKNMFALLNKPGFEKESAEIRKKIKK